MPDIVLMGLRGSGKSTIGRRLAEQLARPFIDLDERVLRHLNFPTVADAWSALGEPAFRQAEHTVLAKLLAKHDPAQSRIIALGGGTPAILEAKQLLNDSRQRGTIRSIYLHATPAELIMRLPPTDANRPRLTTAASPLDEVQTVYNTRDLIYRALADHIIDATGIEQTIAAIRAIL